MTDAKLDDGDEDDILDEEDLGQQQHEDPLKEGSIKSEPIEEESDEEF